jgi:hypothetical protein
MQACSVTADDQQYVRQPGLLPQLPEAWVRHTKGPLHPGVRSRMRVLRVRLWHSGQLLPENKFRDCCCMCR